MASARAGWRGGDDQRRRPAMRPPTGAMISPASAPPAGAPACLMEKISERAALARWRRGCGCRPAASGLAEAEQQRCRRSGRHQPGLPPACARWRGGTGLQRAHRPEPRQERAAEGEEQAGAERGERGEIADPLRRHTDPPSPRRHHRKALAHEGRDHLRQHRGGQCHEPGRHGPCSRLGSRRRREHLLRHLPLPADLEEAEIVGEVARRHGAFQLHERRRRAGHVNLQNMVMPRPGPATSARGGCARRPATRRAAAASARRRPRR